MVDPIDASVIVCTRNRSDLLALTCKSLLQLDSSGLDLEVLIVDNASTDDTPQIARSFATQFRYPVRTVRETTPGLSAARNRAISESRGRVLAFLDDDAFPAEKWLLSLNEALAFDQTYAVGGPVRPCFRSPLPDWFSDRFLPYLTVWDLGTEAIDLVYNEYPRGANMAFRREAFERFGPFSTHLGRKPGSLLSCEEIEVCLRIERGGGKVRYVPEAAVEHVVEGNRITPGWLVARFRAQGTSEAIVEWRHAGLAGLAVGLRRSLERGVRSLRVRSETDSLVRQCELAGALGYVKGALQAAVMIGRYKASPEAGPARRWRPFK